MSEYFTLEAETTDNPDMMALWVNQTLTDSAPEIYADADEGEAGTPIAQILFLDLDGVAALIVHEDHLLVTRQSDVPWERLVDDIRDALRDFFL
jgi:hypothetical protein